MNKNITDYHGIVGRLMLLENIKNQTNVLQIQKYNCSVDDIDFLTR